MQLWSECINDLITQTRLCVLWRNARVPSIIEAEIARGGVQTTANTELAAYWNDVPGHASSPRRTTLFDPYSSVPNQLIT